jgi:hypothetical protein
MKTLATTALLLVLSAGCILHHDRYGDFQAVTLRPNPYWPDRAHVACWAGRIGRQSVLTKTEREFIDEAWWYSRGAGTVYLMNRLLRNVGVEDIPCQRGEGGWTR